MRAASFGFKDAGKVLATSSTLRARLTVTDHTGTVNRLVSFIYLIRSAWFGLVIVTLRQGLRGDCRNEQHMPCA